MAAGLSHTQTEARGVLGEATQSGLQGLRNLARSADALAEQLGGSFGRLEALLSTPVPEPPPPPPREDLSVPLLLDFAQRSGALASRQDLTALLASSAARLAPRVLLFARRGEELVGWDCFVGGQSRALDLRGTRLDLAALRDLSETLDEGQQFNYAGFLQPFYAQLPGALSVEVAQSCFFPLRVAQQCIGVLCADSPSGASAIEELPLRLLALQAGLQMELMLRAAPSGVAATPVAEPPKARTVVRPVAEPARPRVELPVVPEPVAAKPIPVAAKPIEVPLPPVAAAIAESVAIPGEIAVVEVPVLEPVLPVVAPVLVEPPPRPSVLEFPAAPPLPVIALPPPEPEVLEPLPAPPPSVIALPPAAPVVLEPLPVDLLPPVAASHAKAPLSGSAPAVEPAAAPPPDWFVDFDAEPLAAVPPSATIPGSSEPSVDGEMIWDIDEAFGGAATATSEDDGFTGFHVDSPGEDESMAKLLAQAAPRDETDEERNARKLARVVVQDVMLYNTKKIAQGFKTGNLGDPLSDDIFRGAAHYKTKVPPSLYGKRYFWDALVDLLAKGRPELLSTLNIDF